MKLALLEHSRMYVSDAFIHQNPPVPPTPQKVIYAGDGNEPPYETIAQYLEPLMEEYRSNRTASDGVLSVVLHRALSLTRRQAADLRFWEYLSIVRFPAYVAWRYYDPGVGLTNRARFVGGLDENAFSRLWWWAELTVNRFAEDPYDLTRRGAESLEFVKGVVANLCGGNGGLVRSLFSKLFANGSKPSEQQVKETFTKTNALLMTVAIDALSEPEIVEMIAAMD